VCSAKIGIFASLFPASARHGLRCTKNAVKSMDNTGGCPVRIHYKLQGGPEVVLA
jgi:hypothetical protein